jgi:hypothetical protein
MENQMVEISKGNLWTGRVLRVLAILFLLADSIPKILKADFVIKASVGLGFTPNDLMIIGIILLVCVIFYIIPKTTLLGAVLLTGYLGGAVVTNLRIHEPLFSYILVPVYMGVIIWLGSYLSDTRFHRLLPLK